jgi:ABC-2 type transport system ATP-binding protein
VAVAPAPNAGADFRSDLLRLRTAPTLIRAADVGVRYDLQLRRARTLRAGVANLVRPPSRQELWAIRHLDFRVAAGECLAIVGPNGAGKSTLLQALAGVLAPDEGTISRRGAVSALLNLGVGLDPQLTGRENVELVGALMGLSARDTRGRLPDVMDFAELGEFFDAPLRSYSSGMRARLGFAVATMIDPQILILDEIIGTGDATFRAKSKDKVAELVREAHAVVLATHDMAWVSEFANFAMLLDRGRIVASGAPDAVAALHRGRSARPRRDYDCPACGSGRIGTFCSYCGLKLASDAPGEPPKVVFLNR